MAQLSRSEFDRRVKALYPALRAHARRRTPYDPDDAVQDALVAAFESLAGFEDTKGEGAFANWVFRILNNVLTDRLRARASDPEETQLSEQEMARWEVVLHGDERAAFAEAELRHEARLRLRHTDLTELQTVCMAARLRGEPTRETARVLGISHQMVSDHVRAAVARMQRCPLEAFAFADIDRYAWRLGTQVTIYRKPTAVGSGLARERLRRLK